MLASPTMLDESWKPAAAKRSGMDSRSSNAALTGSDESSSVTVSPAPSMD